VSSVPCAASTGKEVKLREELDLQHIMMPEQLDRCRHTTVVTEISSRNDVLYLWLKIPPARSFKFCRDPIFALEEILVKEYSDRC
jgi:hypothetical protein